MLSVKERTRIVMAIEEGLDEIGINLETVAETVTLLNALYATLDQDDRMRPRLVKTPARPKEGDPACPKLQLIRTNANSVS